MPRITTVDQRNREAWLTDLAREVSPIYRAFKLPTYRVTCGWPCSGGKTGRVLGECHGAKSSKGGVYELFISPTLDEPLRVAGVLCHELAHVAAGVEAAHGKGFVKVCRHVGLTKGSPRVVLPGPKLDETLTKLTERLGPYPHQAIVGVPRVKKPPSIIGLECPECGCRVTIGVKWLASAGKPHCGCGTGMVIRDDLEEED